MTSALRAADLEPLHSALSILLSPLDEPSAAAWCRRASEALQTLIGADGAGIVLPRPGEPLGIGVGHWGEQAQAAIDVYTRRYGGQNPVDVRHQLPGVRVWTRSAFWPQAEREPSGHDDDWCRSDEHFDSLGMSAPSPPDTGGEAAALITVGSSDRFAPGGREEQLLRLLQPAFAAGIAILTLARSWRETLGAALDVADAALAIVRPDGALLHATPALLALIGGDSRAGVLLAAIQALARELAQALGRRQGLPTPGRSIEIPGGRYELRATFVQAAHVSQGPLILVAVTPPAGMTPSGTELQARFHLTPREAEVTLLLVQGARDRTIARALGIRPSTARHHVEHVLMKLGIQARAAVAARVREDRW
jgi:DNA-binding CsgD family transcriptional regulator